jgi:hypothetical protein
VAKGAVQLPYPACCSEHRAPACLQVLYRQKMTLLDVLEEHLQRVKPVLVVMGSHHLCKRVARAVPGVQAPRVWGG